MLGGLLKKVLGTENEGELKKLRPLVSIVNEFENDMRARSDDELKAMTGIFRERLSQGESLDDILPEAFAVVREVARRVLECVILMFK